VTGPPYPVSVAGARLLVAATWVVALVVLLAVAVLASIAPTELDGEAPPDSWSLAVGVVSITVQTTALARAYVWRRTTVVVAFVWACAIVPVAAGAGVGAATGATTVAVLVAGFVVAVDGLGPQVLAALVVGAALLALGEVVRAARGEGLTGSTLGIAVLQGLSTVALAAIVGAVVGARREAALARADQVRAVASERAALAEATVARQRTAMARELHDIAAHHLSGIAVMTAALDRQIDTDPEGAKVAVRQVRQQSTAMLKDLRHLVALLREDDADAARRDVSPETLGGVRLLIEQARRTGRVVELRVAGVQADALEELELGPLAQLAAYRTVQEALANAARHAPGAACEVVVDASDPAALVVAVHSEPPSAPQPRGPGDRDGFGLIGMRERAELVDADLAAGPTPDGGFAVTLTVPRSTEEAP